MAPTALLGDSKAATINAIHALVGMKNQGHSCTHQASETKALGSKVLILGVVKWVGCAPVVTKLDGGGFRGPTGAPKVLASIAFIKGGSRTCWPGFAAYSALLRAL